ncbi:MAG: IclR family transcriptional regulator [Deltaproteobacteria bacterium]|nr:IclR family transcriptional regulator [Deltaproteobacteria bacterium]
MNETGKGQTRYRVQALERALDLLDCFTFQDRDMNLSELVQKTGLHKATVKRLVSNLASRGYLQQDPVSKRYQLGLRLFELGGIVFSSLNLREAAASPMTRLQNETGATVLLGIALDDQLVYVGKREGLGMIRISSDIGWRRPLHYGMLGMVLLAYRDPEDVRRILKKTPLEAHTPFSITDEDAFSIRLEQIRNQGYVVEKEEAVEGIIGAAAPVRNYSRQVVAALGIALPISQSHLRDGVDDYVKLLTRSCDEISSDLGYLKI